MKHFKRFAAMMLASVLAVSSMFVSKPIVSNAAAPTVTVSQSAVSVENGKSTSVVVTVQN